MLQGEHSAILLTFIKLPFVIMIFVLSTIEWPFYTSFTLVLHRVNMYYMSRLIDTCRFNVKRLRIRMAHILNDLLMSHSVIDSAHVY